MMEKDFELQAQINHTQKMNASSPFWLKLELSHCCIRIAREKKRWKININNRITNNIDQPPFIYLHFEYYVKSRGVGCSCLLPICSSYSLNDHIIYSIWFCSICKHPAKSNLFAGSFTCGDKIIPPFPDKILSDSEVNVRLRTVGPLLSSLRW